jgi:hypothetical protein
MLTADDLLRAQLRVSVSLGVIRDGLVGFLTTCNVGGIKRMMAALLQFSYSNTQTLSHQRHDLLAS